jgi:uncharacterized pyridoxamine 5'-phosphate oxidase family protein
MTNTEKVWEYLDKAQIFYVTTVDGDQPKCRPFSFKMMANGKIYFGVGTFKDCYRQLERNPKIEIVASDGKGFLRYYGKASLTTTRPCSRRPAQEADYIPKMYNEKTGHKLGMFSLGEATAELRNLAGIQESLTM